MTSWIKRVLSATFEPSPPAASSAEADALYDRFSEFTLEIVKGERDRLYETWKTLESKAQVNTTVSGIFFAAAFAYIKNTSFKVGENSLIPLCLAIILLVISIFFSVRVMRVRSVKDAIDAPWYNRYFEDARAAGVLSHDAFKIIQEEQIQNWLRVNQIYRGVLREKALLLEQAQDCLLVSSICILALTLFNIAS